MEKVKHTFFPEWYREPVVVFDCETTGLSKSDAILSIGAVVLREGEIHLEEGFEVTLISPFNSASVSLHGITAQKSREIGIPEKQGVRAFHRFLNNRKVAGHHILFDCRMVSQCLHRNFQFSLDSPALDTGLLARELETSAIPPFDEPLPDNSLDSLCQRLNLPPFDRHTAPGDAFLTAQALLKCYRACIKAQINPWESNAVLHPASFLHWGDERAQ